jgi:hypothetical protein
MARRNDFLEGVQRGMQAYLQTHAMMLQQQQSQTNQQYQQMQMRSLEQSQKERMSPQEQADLNLQSGLKQAEAKHALEQKWSAEDEGKAKIKRGENEARVRALNAEAKGRGIFYWVDENGAIKESRENIQKDTGGAGKVPVPMKFKDAIESTNGLFASFGIENPQRTPVFNRILALVRSDNYEAAQATLRVYAIVPNTRIVGVKGDFKYTLPTGEQVDPQEYATFMAMNGESDDAIKAMLDDAAKQAQESGALPAKENVIKKWLGKPNMSLPENSPDYRKQSKA